MTGIGFSSRTQYVIVASFLASLVILLGSAPLRGQRQEAPGPGLEDRLQALVDEATSDPETPGALLAVIGTDGLSWVGASGVAEVAREIPLRPDTPVRLSSNTKTYVAATVLRLVENGSLALDTPIASLLSRDVIDLLASDGYAVQEITVRHLLTHTGGLADHAVASQYLALVQEEPQRRWARGEQIEGLTLWADPVARPGQRVSYSDTGYLLLGSIIERTTDLPLASAVRNLLAFERLDLAATWWEREEPRPEGLPDRAHQYMGHVDTYSWDPSIDLFGGGGLVATVGDLARFWTALFDGQVFQKPETLEVLLTTPVESGARRMGLTVHQLDGWTLYEKSGFWGSRGGFVPELDLAVAAVVTQQAGGEERAFDLICSAIRTVRRLLPAPTGSESTQEGS